ncbi:MAG TPA: hypothetical protein VFY57_00905 [Rubrobacteraceae bacterium]|nr:hypothetical protein [Rubrobacteraceae bacterium]
MAPLRQEAGGKEVGLAGERHARALQHHPEEHHQVAVVLDQVEYLLHRRRV